MIFSTFPPGRFAVSALILWCVHSAPAQSAVAPLSNAHAHNDYEHDRPLLDALSHGFCSVEADIHLVDGELLVAHDRDQVRPERTLESLYLKVLRQRSLENDGRIFPGGPEFTLLVDIKSDGESTYEVLKRVLASYRSMLTSVSEGTVQTNAVRVILSGNRPTQTVSAEPDRLVFIDGRLSDLDALPPVSLMPLLSDNWNNHFGWHGEGEMPDEELHRLKSLVDQCRRNGRRIRFWASPDMPASWALQKRAGVSLINTDRLAALAEFLGRAAEEGAGSN